MAKFIPSIMAYLGKNVRIVRQVRRNCSANFELQKFGRTFRTELELDKGNFLAPSSLPALANERLFELTWHPSLTLAVSSSSAETTKNLAVVR